VGLENPDEIAFVSLVEYVDEDARNEAFEVYQESEEYQALLDTNTPYFCYLSGDVIKSLGESNHRLIR